MSRSCLFLVVYALVARDVSAWIARPVGIPGIHGVARVEILCRDGSNAGPQLSGSQRRTLRAHAGRLAAAKELHYVQIADLERSADEVSAQLAAVELVRCKFVLAEKKAEVKIMAAELAGQTGAAVAEVIGHTALLYRPSPARLISLG